MAEATPVKINIADGRTCAIAVPLSEQMSSGEQLSEASSLVRERAVVTTLDQLWDSGSTVTYSFLGGTAKQQAKVVKVVLEWFPYANINFTHVDTAGTLRISFDPSSGSWSYVGRVNQQIPNPKPTMNFGWIEDTADVSEEERGVILHEFGHVLGLLHEHQSPARGGTLTLDENAVYGYYGYTQGWDDATIKQQIIDVFYASEVSNYSALDLKSIMMYFMPYWLNEEETPVPPNYHLSEMDKAYMQFLASGATIAKAIKDANGDAHQIRLLFTSFQISARRASAPAKGGDLGAATSAVGVGAAPGRGLESDPTDEELLDLIPEHWTLPAAIAMADSPVALNAPEGVLRSVFTRDHLWTPGQVITYGFLNQERATDYRKTRVANVFRFYERYTSLTFQLEPNAHLLDFGIDANRQLCKIRIDFGPPWREEGGGDIIPNLGWSKVGKKQITSEGPEAGYPGIPYTGVYLAAQAERRGDDDRWPWYNKISNSIIYHEIGHALGLHHEQAVAGDWLSNPATTEPGMVRGTGFDPKSNMLYPFFRYRNSLRMTGFNFYPSGTDLDFLRLLYPDQAGTKTLRLHSGSEYGQASHCLALCEFDFPSSRKVMFQTGKSSHTTLQTSSRRRMTWPLRTLLAATSPRLPTISGRFFLPQPGHPGFYLTLQFPGRYLDQASYAWDTSSAGIYGQFIKPTVVNEAEFRLVDQLYDWADIVTGPNGTNLSIVYNQLINNLLPKYVENGLAQQQDQIRQWLLKDVQTTQWISDIMERQQAREQALARRIAESTAIPNSGLNTTPEVAAAARPVFDIASKPTANGERLNRIELSELLMNEYLYAKQDWEIERDGLITKATEAELGTSESQRNLDALTRQLSHITDTRQAQLAAKYSDAVVRGYSHTIRQYMGYLDISSPAEALQDAKDSLREAAMSSLDGSMNVYPVQMTPLDWFAGLSTSFSLEDLTQDPEVIRSQIKAKSQEIDTLNSLLVSLELGAKGDPTELRNMVQAAQTTLDKAQSELSLKYSSNIIAMAKTFLNATGKVEIGALATELKVPEEFLSPLPDMMDAVQTAQTNLMSSSRTLSQLMAAQALADATDTRQQQKQLRIQIQGLTADLKELETRWQVLTAGKGGVRVASNDDDTVVLGPVPRTPIELPPENTSGGSRWQTISLYSDQETRNNASSDYAVSENTDWSCNAWFASASRSSANSSGGASNSSESSKDTIELAFRATLATVDRGGWFQPQFFTESNAFYKACYVSAFVLYRKLTDYSTKVNPDISWEGTHGLMRGFPMGFLLVKDVTIRITHSADDASASAQNDMAAAATAGGAFCFSYSNSSSSSSSSTASHFQAYSNGYMVKIPGPQILGYMIQKTGPDLAQQMPTRLPDGFFIPDDEYDSVVNGPPAHSINTGDTDPGGSATGKRPAPPPTITQDKLRDVLEKMLDDKIGELFEKVARA
ncbi:hypothetical protein FB451DRAFT_1568024 [Mycena latifolia]|nr:hypothetical protein FB451DRAFT_1568024 [Mycena latifolia]